MINIRTFCLISAAALSAVSFSGSAFAGSPIAGTLTLPETLSPPSEETGLETVEPVSPTGGETGGETETGGGTTGGGATCSVQCSSAVYYNPLCKDLSQPWIIDMPSTTYYNEIQGPASCMSPEDAAEEVVEQSQMWFAEPPFSLIDWDLFCVRAVIYTDPQCNFIPYYNQPNNGFSVGVTGPRVFIIGEHVID